MEWAVLPGSPAPEPNRSYNLPGNKGVHGGGSGGGVILYSCVCINEIQGYALVAGGGGSLINPPHV